MEIFKIEVNETLARIIEIEAVSLEQALFKTRQKYFDEEIVLDNCDFLTAEIKPAMID